MHVEGRPPSPRTLTAKPSLIPHERYESACGRQLSRNSHVGHTALLVGRGTCDSGRTRPAGRAARHESDHQDDGRNHDDRDDADTLVRFSPRPPTSVDCWANTRTVLMTESMGAAYPARATANLSHRRAAGAHGRRVAAATTDHGHASTAAPI